MRRTHLRSILLFVALFATGCKSSVDNLLDHLDDRVDTLTRIAGRGVVHGAVGELDTSAATLRLLGRVDSMLGVYRSTLLGAPLEADLVRVRAALLDDLDKELQAILDPVTGAPMRRNLVRMVDEILATARPRVAGIRDELLGVETEQRIDAVLRTAAAAIRRELLGQETTRFVAELRDTLIGPTTQGALASVLANARLEYETALDHTGETFSGVAIGIIVALAVAVAGVIAWAVLLHRKKSESERMLDLVTEQIHYLDDKAAYDRLTSEIRAKAKTADLEPKLHEFLRKRGRVGATSWAARMKPVAPIEATGGTVEVIDHPGPPASTPGS